MSELIPQHGGYRKLRSFQVAQLVYDVTVRFCYRYIDKLSRTRDQMVHRRRGRACRILQRARRSRRLPRKRSSSRRWRAPAWKS